MASRSCEAQCACPPIDQATSSNDPGFHCPRHSVQNNGTVRGSRKPLKEHRRKRRDACTGAQGAVLDAQFAHAGARDAGRMKHANPGAHASEVSNSAPAPQAVGLVVENPANVPAPAVQPLIAEPRAPVGMVQGCLAQLFRLIMYLFGLAPWILRELYGGAQEQVAPGKSPQQESFSQNLAEQRNRPIELIGREFTWTLRTGCMRFTAILLLIMMIFVPYLIQMSPHIYHSLILENSNDFAMYHSQRLTTELEERRIQAGNCTYGTMMSNGQYCMNLETQGLNDVRFFAPVTMIQWLMPAVWLTSSIATYILYPLAFLWLYLSVYLLLNGTRLIFRLLGYIPRHFDLIKNTLLVLANVWVFYGFIQYLYFVLYNWYYPPVPTFFEEHLEAPIGMAVSLASYSGSVFVKLWMKHVVVLFGFLPEFYTWLCWILGVYVFYWISPFSKFVLNIQVLESHSWLVREGREWDLRTGSERVREKAYDPMIVRVSYFHGNQFLRWLSNLVLFDPILRRHVDIPWEVLAELTSPRFDVPGMDVSAIYDRLCEVGRLSPMYNLPTPRIDWDWQRETIFLAHIIITIRRAEHAQRVFGLLSGPFSLQ